SKSATSTFRQFSKVDKKSNRTKWCLDQAFKENWEDYQNLLWSNLRARILKELCKEEISKEIIMQYSKMKELNQIWEVIEDAIIKVGKKVLSSKDIKNELEKQNSRLKECKDLKQLSYLVS
ncbi:38719_t:CDS:1, partial [Gigaspora margarita]